MRRRQQQPQSRKISMSEPDYTPVPGEDRDPESGQEETMPSSFYIDGDGKKQSLFPRSYTFRRRLGWGGLVCFFVAAVVVVTFELGRRRGHLGQIAGELITVFSFLREVSYFLLFWAVRGCDVATLGTL